jgi:RNA polymerase sigma-70 factor (ECF subfamily)
MGFPASGVPVLLPVGFVDGPDMGPSLAGPFAPAPLPGPTPGFTFTWADAPIPSTATNAATNATVRFICSSLLTGRDTAGVTWVIERTLSSVREDLLTCQENFRNELPPSANHSRMPGTSDLAAASDADLVRRAAGGDKDAFGAIFERYHGVVYRFARAMTGAADRAEDVTQEVFVVLLRDLARYEPHRAMLSTYLYGVARNVSRDRLRRERRLLAVLSNAWGGATEPEDPFASVASTEAGAEVRRALALIPVRYREAIVLCDLHDLSYADAGAVLGASTAAVRSRLHRGRQLLKQRLLRARATRAREARSWIRFSV